MANKPKFDTSFNFGHNVKSSTKKGKSKGGKSGRKPKGGGS
jgi:hypothetical protein